MVFGSEGFFCFVSCNPWLEISHSHEKDGSPAHATMYSEELPPPTVLFPKSIYWILIHKDNDIILMKNILYHSRLKTISLRNTALRNNHINFTHESFLKLYLRNRVLYSSIYIRHIQYCVPDSKCIDFVKIPFSLDRNGSRSHEGNIPSDFAQAWEEKKKKTTQQK